MYSFFSTYLLFIKPAFFCKLQIHTYFFLFFIHSTFVHIKSLPINLCNNTHTQMCIPTEVTSYFLYWNFDKKCWFENQLFNSQFQYRKWRKICYHFFLLFMHVYLYKVQAHYPTPKQSVIQLMYFAGGTTDTNWKKNKHIFSCPDIFFSNRQQNLFYWPLKKIVRPGSYM